MRPRSTTGPMVSSRPGQSFSANAWRGDVDDEVRPEAAHVPVEVGPGRPAVGQRRRGHEMDGGEVEQRARRGGDVDQFGVVVGRIERHLIGQ